MMKEEKPMSDVRLIERWLPIAELSEESVRERRSMTSLPPNYYLHVWWARRPLVASRAAILASLLPGDADKAAFMSMIGIHGDPIAAKRRISVANRTGERLGKDAYGYPRAFSYSPTAKTIKNLLGNKAAATVLDPTAGGGAIPFEGTRLGLNVIANDLNPVAATVLTTTVELPRLHGLALADELQAIGAKFLNELRTRLEDLFPPEPEENTRPDAYLWARTIPCPYCAGVVPLSPNWRLAPDGQGVRLILSPGSGPGSDGRTCSFEVVNDDASQSVGTVSGGDATCPYHDCGRVIENAEIKRLAESGQMSELLYAVVIKKAIETKTKTGKRGAVKWVRAFRSPRPEDYGTGEIRKKIHDGIEVLAATNRIPNESLPDGTESWTHGNTPAQYGARNWVDLFSPRQLYCHGNSVDVFVSLVEDDQARGLLTDLRRSAYLYLALSIDKMLDYNSRSAAWHPGREVLEHTFRDHAFPLKWSFAEMAPLVDGNGYEWAVRQTTKCVRELVGLVRTETEVSVGSLFDRDGDKADDRSIEITCKSGANLEHLEEGSVDVVVMDPPYGANVMYSELSDFFFVWLKRTAGIIRPDLFTRYLTDKDNEAVANKAKFSGQKGAEKLANRDYQEKMQGIFAECKRVLKADGVLTVMFTHKATGAWDALTSGLIDAGFIVSASWPVKTESEDSMHIKKKAAARSTIFLVCRPRPAEQSGETTYWEDVEPLVAKAVRTRVEEFQKAGIGGVDLYLASFGPALEEFSRHWPLKRGTPRPEPLAKKRRKQAELFEEEFDPYAVTPEDALDAARREVKTWRLNQLTHTKGRADLDPTTSWFVLAWDAFKAPVFSYDEGLRLARAVGADLEGQLIGRLCEKKGSDIKLWDSATRAAKSGLGPADGSRAMIDAIHHAAHRGRTRTLEGALDLLKDAGLENDPQFLAALEAVLEVLPPSRGFVGFDVATGDAKSAADDFDALEKLRRLAFSDKVDEPQQLSLFAEEAV